MFFLFFFSLFFLFFNDTATTEIYTLSLHDALPISTRELISLADSERVQAVDLFQFTSLIARDYDEAQKMVLLEAMWGLVFSDGIVAKHETSLMRRVSKLLDVKPGFLAEARKRASS